MTDRINRTSICCIVFLDIIDYSKKTDSEQIAIKNNFNDLINHSLKDVAQNDCIILDTGDGAAIAYMGSPEDALFMAMSIRDGILKGNTQNAEPAYVRFGINLGPVRVVNDINGRPNIIGDGINVAQRIMSFAKANEILVSRSYYEVTSRLTQEISKMFDYSGVKYDKHVREHEVYSVRSTEDQTAAKYQPTTLLDNFKLTKSLTFLNKVNWKYTVLSLLILPALFALVKLSATTLEPIISLANSEPTKAKKMPASLSLSVLPKNDGLMQNEMVKNSSLEAVKLANENMLAEQSKKTLQQEMSANSKTDTLIQEKETQDELIKAKPAKKEAKKKTKQKTPQESDLKLPAEPQLFNADTPKSLNTATKPIEHPAKTTELIADKTQESMTKTTKEEKSGWKKLTDSMKQGQENNPCTQAQAAMVQCH